MKKRYDNTILATACIPWDEDNNFIKPLFKRQIEHLINNGITHIYLFGTAGEGYAINNQQFEEIVSYFSSLMEDDNLYPMVGLIELSPFRMEEKLNIAYKYGIRDFQFSLPSWHKLSYDEIVTFMDYLLLRHNDCNFLCYNLARTKRFIEPLELITLAKKYNNLVAVKYTRLTDEDINIFKNNDTPLQLFLTENNFAKLSNHISCSLLLSIGNLDLNIAHEFFNYVKENNQEKVDYYCEKFNSLRSTMKAGLNGVYIDGAYDKLYVKYVLEQFPLKMLAPYNYVSEDLFKIFKKNTKRLL